MRKKSEVILGIITIVLVCIIGIFTVINYNSNTQVDVSGDASAPNSLYLIDHYEDYDTWIKDLDDHKNRYKNIDKDVIADYGQYLTETQIEELKELNILIQESKTFQEMNTYLFEIESIYIPVADNAHTIPR